MLSADLFIDCEVNEGVTAVSYKQMAQEPGYKLINGNCAYREQLSRIVSSNRLRPESRNWTVIRYRMVVNCKLNMMGIEVGKRASFPF